MIEIKPLEWTEFNPYFFQCVDAFGVLHAVEKVGENRFNAGKWERTYGDVGTAYETAQLAMDAEYEDYKARVLSVVTTPSVAVKAVRDAAHDAAVALEAVLEKPEDKDRQHHARYYLDALRSALSAQVQDVEETGQ